MAITDKFGTTIDGGLISTVTMLLRELNSTTETAGISGIQGANMDNPAFWAGGSYDQATGGTANAIMRHDGSGHLANGHISWDTDGSVRFDGVVASPFIDVTDVTTVEGVELYFSRWSNNLYVNSSTGKTLNIPNRADFNGQIVRIHNVGSSPIQLGADVGAGSIFWLPAGASSNLIQLQSGEAVEMICVAIGGAFHSWDVLRIYKCRSLQN